MLKYFPMNVFGHLCYDEPAPGQIRTMPLAARFGSECRLEASSRKVFPLIPPLRRRVPPLTNQCIIPCMCLRRKNRDPDPIRPLLATSGTSWQHLFVQQNASMDVFLRGDFLLVPAQEELVDLRGDRLSKRG